MKYAAIIALALLSSAEAFIAPPISTPTPQSSTSCNGKGGESKEARRRRAARAAGKTKPPKMPYGIEEGHPEYETMKKFAAIIGIRRMKKMERKEKRIRNQLIREGLLVLNEEGRWGKKE